MNLSLLVLPRPPVGRWGRRRIPLLVAALALLAVLAGSSVMASAQVVPVFEDVEVPPSLKTVPVPEIPGIAEIIVNPAAARRLGKALFWDLQVGSDGLTACASCHFHAGSDGRTRNTMNPGFDGLFSPLGPNGTVVRSTLPLHATPPDARTPVRRHSDDVVGSQGIVRRTFLGVADPGTPAAMEQTMEDEEPVFQVAGVPLRQVTPRQAPSVINAAYNHSNFWDGRANYVFNGQTPFGADDEDARITVSVEGAPELQTLRLEACSVASLATVPALSVTEMSAVGRTFPDLADKLLGLTPLAFQQVHEFDSELGALASGGLGLRPEISYRAMIQTAFHPRYWELGDSQIRDNFAMFFGLAVQAYLGTLRSDDSRFDRWRDGTGTLTDQEVRGLTVFMEDGACAECHVGSTFTSASVPSLLADLQEEGGLAPEEIDLTDPVQLTERMFMRNADLRRYDLGYYNVGLRPFDHDPGRGGENPFGQPLAFSARLGPDHAVQGSFKTPSLRNVELTGPYFHSGEAATLMQAVDFYARGGNFFELNLPFLAPEIGPDPGGVLAALVSNEADKRALVAFLLTLTDERVRQEQAPFDHPQLFVGEGLPGTSHVIDCTPEQLAGGTCERFLEVPAVGRFGRPAEGMAPITGFLNLDPFSRATWTPSAVIATLPVLLP